MLHMLKASLSAFASHAGRRSTWALASASLLASLSLSSLGPLPCATCRCEQRCDEADQAWQRHLTQCVRIVGILRGAHKFGKFLCELVSDVLSLCV